VVCAGLGYTKEKEVRLVKKPIPIGYEDIKEIVNKGYYYVDKTMMLKDFLDAHANVTLFTRPQRFGKTLNLSMFRRFFEDERKADGGRIDNGYIFDGLRISDCGEGYLAHQQQYPVISLSLKSGKQRTYENAMGQLKKRIAEEFTRHGYVLQSVDLNAEEKSLYRRLMNWESEDHLFLDALGFMSQCLEKCHGRKTIILIDEYDVPLENAWFAGFYDEMTGFIRSLFESALKTNDALEFAVITGCLRISKESIFTGLNNLQINSVLGAGYGDTFGFTEAEVQDMMRYYGLEDRFPEVKDWYDGYRFDDKEIYNPWSIVNYVHDIAIRSDYFPKAYWSNTSSNSIIKELIEGADREARGEIEQLIAGETLEKPIHEDITYGDIHESKDNLWNFLYFTGYLKSCGQRYDGESTFVKMAIPNTEIRTIYKNTVRSWFDRKVKGDDRRHLIKAIEAGNCSAMEDMINAQLRDTISFFDYQETYYHGFLTGLLKGNDKYLVVSNRESGTGRPDIALKENRFRGKGVLLELKVTKDIRQMEAKCREALEQIETNRYEDDLVSDGYEPILKYGICFFKKGCMVIKG